MYIVLKKNKQTKQTNQVLIVGSIHGDERLGAQVAFHLIKLMVVQFKSDPWIQRLLKTRRVTIVPVPNPFGYDRSMRYEEINGELIDPNTDFPFDQNQPQNCMKSISARVINELFRANQFRIAVVSKLSSIPNHPNHCNKTFHLLRILQDLKRQKH